MSKYTFTSYSLRCLLEYMQTVELELQVLELYGFVGIHANCGDMSVCVHEGFALRGVCCNACKLWRYVHKGFDWIFRIHTNCGDMYVLYEHKGFVLADDCGNTCYLWRCVCIYMYVIGFALREVCGHTCKLWR